MKRNTLFIVLSILLAILLIGVSVLFYMEKQTNKELTEEFQLEKEDLENQYADFSKQYDELKMTVRKLCR